RRLLRRRQGSLRHRAGRAEDRVDEGRKDAGGRCPDGSGHRAEVRSRHEGSQGRPRQDLHQRIRQQGAVKFLVDRGAEQGGVIPTLFFTAATHGHTSVASITVWFCSGDYCWARESAVGWTPRERYLGGP